MLPRAQRLRKNREFQAVYQRRQTWHAAGLTLYIRRRGPVAGVSRVGVVVSKKIAKRAHDRNRIKRRVTEICRTTLLPRVELEGPCDILFVARGPAQSATFTELASDAEELMRRARLIPQTALAATVLEQI